MAKARGRGNRAPFARATERAAKKVSGITDVASTPLNVRTTGLDVGADMRASIRTRPKLGKYAARIERPSVRFEDANGPRGGVDAVCRVKVVLKSCPRMDSSFSSHHGEASPPRPKKTRFFGVPTPPARDFVTPEEPPRMNSGQFFSGLDSVA